MGEIMTNDNRHVTDGPPSLMDIQHLLQTELKVLLADVVRKEELRQALAGLVTKHELDQRLQQLERQQPDLETRIASQQEAIATVELLFQDIKASIEGITGRLDNYGLVIDARRQEVETLREDQQQVERNVRQVEQGLGGLQVRLRELHHDMFGTGDPNGPIAFADRVLAALEQLNQQIQTNQNTLSMHFGQLEEQVSATRQQVAEHGAFIEGRRAIERFLYRWLTRLWSLPLWRRLLVLVIGGGSGIALFEFLRALLR